MWVSRSRNLSDADRASELASRRAFALYVRARIYEALGRKEKAAKQRPASGLRSQTVPTSATQWLQ